MWPEEEGVQLVSAAGELQQGSGSWLRAGPGPAFTCCEVLGLGRVGVQWAGI